MTAKLIALAAGLVIASSSFAVAQTSTAPGAKNSPSMMDKEKRTQEGSSTGGTDAGTSGSGATSGGNGIGGTGTGASGGAGAGTGAGSGTGSGAGGSGTGGSGTGGSGQ
jgi:hypothetical protein